MSRTLGGIKRLRDEAAMFRRFVSGLRGYLETPLSYDDSERIVTAGLRLRERRFLQLAKRGIYEYPASPYRALLEWAGVEYGDLEKLVLADGVEAALQSLYGAGVHVSLEQFKGRQPIERNGLNLEVSAEDFDNPLLESDFEVESSGSTGRRRRMKIDLNLMVEDAAFRRIIYRAHGLESCVFAAWRGVPPDSSGLKQGLLWSKLRLPMERWFSPISVSWMPSSARYAAITRAALRGSRRWSPEAPIAVPETTPLRDASPIVEWMADALGRGLRPLISTAANNGVRIATTAKDKGYDLSGAVFRLGGEPITAGKARVINEVGGYVFSGWAMSETGQLAGGCAAREELDEAHLNSAKIAAFQRPKLMADGETTVDAIYLTTILRSCPKIMLNVDTGDYGVLRERSCGCLLDRLGFRAHLHTIRNYEKLTAGGIQFLGPDILRLVEETLPAAFGGAPTDYQFIEEEVDGDAVSRVYIAVSPRVGEVDDQEVARTALNQLAAVRAGGGVMSRLWQQGQVLQVVRREPYVTASSKTPPIKVIRK